MPHDPEVISQIDRLVAAVVLCWPSPASTFSSLPNGFLWLPGPALSICRAGQRGQGTSQEFPQSVGDESCQINNPTPLFSRRKNSEMYSMDTN